MTHNLEGPSGQPTSTSFISLVTQNCTSFVAHARRGDLIPRTAVSLAHSNNASARARPFTVENRVQNTRNSGVGARLRTWREAAVGTRAAVKAVAAIADDVAPEHSERRCCCSLILRVHSHGMPSNLPRQDSSEWSTEDKPDGLRARLSNFLFCPRVDGFQSCMCVTRDVPNCYSCGCHILETLMAKTRSLGTLVVQFSNLLCPAFN